MSTIRELVELYLADRGLELSPTTIRSGRYKLRALAEFFQNRPLDRPGLTQFLASRPGNQGNRQAHWRADRAFLHWCLARGYLQEDPTKDIRLRQVEPEPSLAPSPDELEDALALLTQSWCDRRNKALFACCFYAGLRASEACELNRERLDLVGRTLAVRGKGGHSRLVPVATPLVRHLAAWLGHLPSRFEFIFPAVPDEDRPASTHQASYHWTMLSRRAGFGRRVRLHDLRHGFGTHLYREGVDIVVIQRLMGHRDIKSTLLYAHAIASRHREDVDRAFSKRRRT